MLRSTEKSFRKFLFIWSGQVLSILGSGVSSFGLSLLLFDATGAATPFAMAFLCSVLPSLVFAPLAGSFADRRSRKAIILLTDSADALLKLVLLGLLLFKRLEIWMIYPMMGISSTLGTFQGPAFSASIPMLVEQKDLGRANGLRQLAGAAQSMLSPLLAGALYPFLGVTGLLAVDLGSYLFAFSTVALSAIPQDRAEESKASSALFTALADFRQAMGYLRRLPRLLAGIFVFAAVNFIANLAMILITPMILAHHDAAIYGLLQTVMGVSMVAGGLLSSLAPNPKNRFAALYGMLIVSGVGLFVAGLSPQWPVIAVGMVAFFLFIPYVNMLSDTLLQSKVESAMLGRVMSVMTVICQAGMPLSGLLAGPLADRVFGPRMLPQGTLGGSFLGRLIGTGQDRGSAVVFLICGGCLAMLCLCCFLHALGKPDSIE